MGELLKRDILSEGVGERGSKPLAYRQTCFYVESITAIFLGFLPLAPSLLRGNKHCCVISPFISLLPPLFPRVSPRFPLPLPCE